MERRAAADVAWARFSAEKEERDANAAAAEKAKLEAQNERQRALIEQRRQERLARELAGAAAPKVNVTNWVAY